MTNKEATKVLCTAMANTFYPDDSVVALALFNNGIDATAEAEPYDKKIFAIAVALLFGYVETSHSEGGVSTAVNTPALINSIKYWARAYDVDPAEYLEKFTTTIADGTKYW